MYRKNLLVAFGLCACVSLALPTSNPLGFLYDLPSGWKVVATEGVFQVVQRPGQTENELYILGGSASFDAKTSMDAELQAEDEAFMKQLGPWSRSGSAKSFEAKGGSGMFELFVGANMGVEFHGQIWSLLAQKKRFGLFAVFPKELAGQLQPDLSAIAKSFRPDPSRKVSGNNAHAKEWVKLLSGSKLRRSTAANHGGGAGSGGEAGEKSLMLFEDGTYYFSSRSMVFMSAGDLSMNSESKDESSGRWSVESDGKKAFIILKEEGKETVRFELEQKGQYILINGVAYTRSKG